MTTVQYSPLFFFLLLCSACSTVIPTAQPVENIQIVRDAWGVPHVIAPTDIEVAYGFAWAQCEDDFVTLQEQMLAIRGRYGEVVGKKGAFADFGIKFMGLRQVVESRYEEDLSADFRAYLDSYVAGINNYAALHPQELLLNDLFPLTPQDIVIGYLLGTTGLSQAQGHLEKILDGTIAQDEAKDAPKGSNAFAISRSKTMDGNTYLAINSHQPLEGWYSWYEAHLISEEGLNMLGGTFPGGATIFHGVNEDLGWAHTVNHVDLSDVYKMEMHPSESLQYQFDGEWKSLEKRTYKAKVKLLGFLKIPIKQKIYESVYGPTFKTKEGFYAWRFAAGQDIRAVEQWYKMNKATGLESFQEALRMQAIPSTNIVYADRQDNIFFISNGKVPVRDPAYDWRKVVPGNTSTTLWTEYYPLDSLPQVLNPASGYVFNTNNTPFSSSGLADNPTETLANQTMTYQHPDMENARSLRFRTLIDDYDKLSYDDFKEIKYDLQYPDQMIRREMMNLELVFEIAPAEHPAQAGILQALQAWDRSYDLENTTAPVFIYFIKILTENLKEANRWCWRCEITEADVLQALSVTQDHFYKKFGGLSVRLGDFQRHIRGDKNLPLAGGPDVLAAMYSKEQKDGTFKGIAGESYIELVQFTPEGIIIETVNAYGSSAEPDSPHYNDQMELFVNQQLKPMTLDRAAVIQNAKQIYHPLRVVPEQPKP